MNWGLDEKEKVRKYLLGTLRDQDEMRQIEEKQLIDNDYEEILSVAEDELIEEYLDSELSEDDRLRFVSHFLITPARKHKISLSRNLRKYAATAATEAKTEAMPSALTPETVDKPAPLDWRSYFSPPVLRFAVICIVLIGAGYGIWRVGFYRSDVDKGLASLQSAYRGTRPIDARITGFEYAAIKDTRSLDDSQPSNTLERDLAEGLLARAVIEDKNAESLYALGKVYLAKKELDKAISYFEESAKLKPANAILESDLGAAYLELGTKTTDSDSRRIDRLEKGLNHLERSIELNPKLPEPRFNRAMCLEALARKDDARSAWNDYIAFDPSSRWADEAKNQIKDLQ